MFCATSLYKSKTYQLLAVKTDLNRSNMRIVQLVALVDQEVLARNYKVSFGNEDPHSIKSLQNLENSFREGAKV